MIATLVLSARNAQVACLLSTAKIGIGTIHALATRIAKGAKSVLTAKTAMNVSAVPAALIARIVVAPESTQAVKIAIPALAATDAIDARIVSTLQTSFGAMNVLIVSNVLTVKIVRAATIAMIVKGALVSATSAARRQQRLDEASYDL